MKNYKTNSNIVIGANGVFCVENWYTEELIASFKTYEARQEWLDKNVNEEGYTKDGIKISIYESF